MLIYLHLAQLSHKGRTSVRCCWGSCILKQSLRFFLKLSYREVNPEEEFSPWKRIALFGPFFFLFHSLTFSKNEDYKKIMEFITRSVPVAYKDVKMSESISCYSLVSKTFSVWFLSSPMRESTIILLSTISHHQYFLAAIEACVSLHWQEIKPLNWI